MNKEVYSNEEAARIEEIQNQERERSDSKLENGGAVEVEGGVVLSLQQIKLKKREKKWKQLCKKEGKPEIHI